MAEGEKLGITAVFDSDAFSKGLAKYNADIEAAAKMTDKDAASMGVSWNDATKRFHDTANKMVPFADVLGKDIPAGAKDATSALAGFSGGAGVMTGVITGLVTSGTTFLLNSLTQIAGAAANAGKAISDFVKESTQGAARGEELGLAAQYMGQQAGYTARQVSDLTQQLIAAGVTDDIAGEAISKLAQNDLDLAKATELLKVAQGGSIMTGRAVTDVYMDMITAVSYGMPRVLKQYGITLDQTKANEAYAKSLGRNVKSLTEEETKQAGLNAVLEKGAGLQGVYAEAMKLPAAQLRDLTGVLIPKLMDAVGTPFQDAFMEAVSAVSRLVVWITTAISEGGALYPVMTALAAAASVIADTLGGLADAALAAGDALFGSLGGSMGKTANSAVIWGTNIVTSLANGMMQGAADAMNAAMNFISDLLSGWLSPGSPPKVAPDIDKWGADAIGTWLGGFSQADFSALNEIQGPLQSALNLAFGSAGKGAASEAFNQLSAEILTAIDAGEMSAQLFQDITAAGGQYGEQIALLVRDQVALTAATREQAAAQQALTEAQNRGAAAGVKVSAGIKEYNAMLRRGASKEALAVKLAEIKASEKEKALADQQGAAAQVSVDAASDKVSALKETVALQAAIVAQQQKLAQAAAVAGAGVGAGAGALAKAGGGAGGGGAGGGAGVDQVSLDMKKKTGSLGANLGETIDKMKTDITAKFNELWKSVADTASTLWEQIKVYLGPAMNNIRDTLAEMNKWWSNHKEEIGRFVDGVIATLGRFGKFVGDLLAPAVHGGLGLITGYVKAFWQEMNGDFDGAQVTRLTSWTLFWLDMKKSFKVFYNGSISLMENYFNTWRTFFDNIKKVVENFVEDVKTAFTSVDWTLLGAAVMNGIRQGIIDRVNSVVGDAVNAANSIISGIRDRMGISSPSKVMAQLGEQTMAGLAQGITRTASVPAMAAARAASAIPMAMTPVMSGATNNINMNMGGVSIYNPMNMAMFESMLTRVMRGAK